MEQKRKWAIPLSESDLAEMGQRAALDLSLFGVAKSEVGDGFVEVLDPRGLRVGDPGVVMVPAPKPWRAIPTGRKGIEGAADVWRHDIGQHPVIDDPVPTRGGRDVLSP